MAIEDATAGPYEPPKAVKQFGCTAVGLPYVELKLLAPGIPAHRHHVPAVEAISRPRRHTFLAFRFGNLSEQSW